MLLKLVFPTPAYNNAERRNVAFSRFLEANQRYLNFQKLPYTLKPSSKRRSVNLSLTATVTYELWTKVRWGDAYGDV